MPDDQTTPAGSSIIKEYLSWPNLQRAAEIALQQRREAGEIMTYHEDGWVVREYPGRLIVRLALIGEFRAEDFPIER